MYHFLIASLPELLWGQLPEYTQEEFYAAVEESLSSTAATPAAKFIYRLLKRAL